MHGIVGGFEMFAGFLNFNVLTGKIGFFRHGYLLSLDV
jgi:hypothetical protein